MMDEDIVTLAISTMTATESVLGTATTTVAAHHAELEEVIQEGLVHRDTMIETPWSVKTSVAVNVH